jgi:hypothetical protein
MTVNCSAYRQQMARYIGQPWTSLLVDRRRGQMALLAEYLAFSKAQSPRKRIISHVLVIYFSTLMFGAFAGLWVSNVIPSTAGMYGGAICGGVNGLIWVALLERNLRNPTLRNAPAIRDVRAIKILKYRWSRVPFILAANFMFGYMAFAWGYPWLYNKTFGSVVTKTFTVTGWEGTTGRSCPRPEIGYNTFVLAPHALCVRSDAQARMPRGASIRVVGPQSILGLNARDIYSIPGQSATVTSTR